MSWPRALKMPDKATDRRSGMFRAIRPAFFPGGLILKPIPAACIIHPDQLIAWYGRSWSRKARFSPTPAGLSLSDPQGPAWVKADYSLGTPLRSLH